MMDNAQFAERVARLPLAYQPGSTWDYSISTDVLGRIVELVSGQTLGTFLKARLFDPLGMKDTGFGVADPERQARIAEALPGDSISSGPLFDPRRAGGLRIRRRRADEHGCRLQPLPADAAQRRPARRQAPPERSHAQGDDARPARRAGAAHAAVPARCRLRFRPGLSRCACGRPPRARTARVGEYYWGGAGGTYMWVDPANDLFIVYMMQSPKQRSPHRAALRELVYGAVVDAKVAGK